MAQTSREGRLINLPATLLGADYPVAVSTVQTVVNNLAHLTDEHCQVRVNWAAQAYGGGSTPADPYPYGTLWSAARSEAPSIYQVEFPLTWLSPTKPANLDIVMAVAGVDADGSEDYTLRVVVCPANTPVGQSQNPIMDVSESLAEATLHQRGFRIQSSDFTDQIRSALVPIAGPLDDPASVLALVCMLRLEVHFDYTATAMSSEDVFFIARMYLKEFA